MGTFGNGQANVVSLASARIDMRFPVISEVHAYWEALRNGRPLPLRAEIDPRGIERALENAFILERIAPGMARFRLAGMHLNDLMGMEVRGMPITSFFTPRAREEMTRVLEGVFGGPEIVEITVSAEYGIGKPAIEGKILILPLRSDLGDITRALGCFASVGPIGRAPRRFDIISVRTTKIRGLEQPVKTRAAALDASERNTTEQNAANQSFGTPKTADTGFHEGASDYQAPKASKRPNLRLVKSDE